MCSPELSSAVVVSLCARSDLSWTKITRWRYNHYINMHREFMARYNCIRRRLFRDGKPLTEWTALSVAKWVTQKCRSSYQWTHSHLQEYCTCLLACVHVRSQTLSGGIKSVSVPNNVMHARKLLFSLDLVVFDGLLASIPSYSCSLASACWVWRWLECKFNKGPRARKQHWLTVS